MIKIIIVMSLLLISGCVGQTTSKITQTKPIVQTFGCVDMFAQNYYNNNGWGISGYTHNKNNKFIKIGEISSFILYDISNHPLKPIDRVVTEPIKEEGHILGAFLKINF